MKVISLWLETGKMHIPHTKINPSGSPEGVELGRGAGDTSKPGEELEWVADGDLSTGVGVLRRELVDRDEDRGSMVVPDAVVLVGESIGEPMMVVRTERRGQGGERRLTHRRTRGEEKEGESQGRLESRKSKVMRGLWSPPISVSFTRWSP